MGWTGRVNARCWQEAISAAHSASHTPIFAPFQLEMGSHSLQIPLKGRDTSRWSINKILEKSLDACGFISFKKVSPFAGGLLSSATYVQAVKEMQKGLHHLNHWLKQMPNTDASKALPSSPPSPWLSSRQEPFLLSSKRTLNWKWRGGR